MQTPTLHIQGLHTPLPLPGSDAASDIRQRTKSSSQATDQRGTVRFPSAVGALEGSPDGGGDGREGTYRTKPTSSFSGGSWGKRVVPLEASGEPLHAPEAKGRTSRWALRFTSRQGMTPAARRGTI
jgi:hypothetical protein